jgi:hypothetical protein
MCSTEGPNIVDQELVQIQRLRFTLLGRANEVDVTGGLSTIGNAWRARGKMTRDDLRGVSLARGRLINAKAETVARLSMFRGSYARRNRLPRLALGQSTCNSLRRSLGRRPWSRKSPSERALGHPVSRTCR